MKQIKEGTRSTRVENLRRHLIKLCYWYYVKADPIVPDRTYDTLFKELEQLEKIADAAFYPTPYSPTQIIYGDLENQYPAWAKAKDLHVLYDDQILKIPPMPKTK